MSDIENPAGDTRPIGVFDSGLGGLTVARAIATALPHESVYYFGDTKRCPYGTRTEDEVRSFALQAGRWLSKHDVKIMVIACNTATAAALRLAQQVLDVPVIGVIAPGARAAINSTRTRRVGVLATNLTIRSGAYTRAIQDLDAGVDVYGCPASSFVEVVEHELASGAHLQEQWLENEDIFDTPAVRALVGATVEPLRDHGIDTVVLGCTHFPLLVGPIRHALGPGVRVVSSAEETTRELTDILTRREQLAGDAAEPQHRFDEIVAVWTIHPCRPDDDGSFGIFHDRLFACQLGFAIYGNRVRHIVFDIRHMMNAIENIIGRDMDNAFSVLRQPLRTEMVGQFSRFRFVFRLVHGGIGGAVDDALK